MGAFFDSVLGAIETALNFLYNTINALVMAIDAIHSAIYLPGQLATLLPALVGSAVLITVALGVVKFLVGR